MSTNPPAPRGELAFPSKKIRPPEPVKTKRPYNRHWTYQEDAMLRNAMATTVGGARRTWKMVASCVNGKSPKQCRERWMNHLDPELSLEPFDADEDQTVKALYETLGSSWTTVAQLLNDWRRLHGYTGRRSDGRCKNHIVTGVAKNEVLKEPRFDSIFDQESASFEQVDDDLAFLADVDLEDVFDTTESLLYCSERPLTPLPPQQPPLVVEFVSKNDLEARIPSIDLKRAIFRPFKTTSARLLKPSRPMFRGLNARIRASPQFLVVSSDNVNSTPRFSPLLHEP